MYCTTNDIINELSPKVAAQLTDSAVPDLAVITSKILEAGNYINSHLEGVFELPLKNSHDYIKLITVEFVKFLLKKKRLTIDRLDESVKWVDERLNELSTGRAELTGEVRISPFLVHTGSKTLLTEKIWKGYDN